MSGFLLAEFKSATDLRQAAQTAAAAGHAAQDALCPTAVMGLGGLLAPSIAPRPIGWVMFIAGVTGACAGYFIQWFSSAIDYPTDSGGRPLNSWPAFLLVPYEVAILSAAIVGILAWMWMCGFPKLFHPLFNASASERANQDRYLLVFEARPRLAAWIAAHLKPIALHEDGA